MPGRPRDDTERLSKEPEVCGSRAVGPGVRLVLLNSVAKHPFAIGGRGRETNDQQRQSVHHSALRRRSRPAVIRE